MSANNAPKILLTMTCPSCGGQVECEEGEDMILCKYCGSVFGLENDAGMSKVMYKNVVNKEKVMETVRKWMKTGPKAKDLLTAHTISEAYPIYLPFWRLVARGKACVCGEEVHKDKDGHETRTPHEALVNREYVYSDIACDPGDLGIRAVSIDPSAQAIAFDDQSIVTFQATESRTDAYKAGGEMIMAEALDDGKHSMDDIYFSKAFFFPRSFTLVYYPFWIVRYKYQERDYFLTIDGISGNTVSGRAPGSAGAQSTSAGVGGTVGGALMGLGIGGGLLGGAALGSGEAGIGIFVVCLIIAIAIFGYFWKRFRYGDEILEGAMKGKGLNTKKAVSYVQETSAPRFDYYN
ncbi:MAG TPA: hypothetical protein O0X39_05385 [Methanocorpusculum sp.]|nr:hypothetical protein [Methanocorpusculum sp.]